MPRNLQGIPPESEAVARSLAPFRENVVVSSGTEASGPDEAECDATSAIPGIAARGSERVIGRHGLLHRSSLHEPPHELVVVSLHRQLVVHEHIPPQGQVR